MNKRKHQYVLGLTLACMCYGNILKAGPVEDACEFAFAQLCTVTGANLDRKEGDFVYVNSHYKGCILTLSGDKTKVNGDYYPANLFYPFEGSERYRDGWRADSEADGPDGSFFRIQKSDSFCLISGEWNGGDDNHPKYVPSPDFRITVKCAAIKK